MMRARVAVCASIYEGLCNAIIEALACGTPVVSRPIVRTVRPKSCKVAATARSTPVGDAPAMAAAIEAALLRDPDRAALMARGLNYTAARAAERFLEIVAELRRAPALRMRRSPSPGRRRNGPLSDMLQPLLDGVLRKAARHTRSKPFACAIARRW